MRKHQQKQVIELIETLDAAQSAELYGDAQDGAIAVADFIEQIEGEDTQTVSLLAEYCEMLFKAHNGELGIKLLKKQLAKIRSSVYSELKPNRIEIVFICYNASMSDCVLSIYEAAKVDPQCEAVWLPVPYYERNSDGTPVTMHYEGAEHYPDIECADWQRYDIEARHPDIIVTYNPYDEGNNVTSVHPAFYCKRLRELTDLLLYVPYFVSVDKVAEYFTTVAGCVYAHKVVVQSESIRKAYIHGFKKAYGNRLGKPEDKFIALGSPKFDKVINTKRENCELPKEWRELICDRKVIFYNTTVGAILMGDEQYLKKLRCVLDVFINRNDVVLWWRPHPLCEATFKSMRPQLFEEYKKIVSEYKLKNWGIYDDTTDLHRAIAWSDGYFGDESSLVSMYRLTEKPIILQNVFSYFYDSSQFSLAVSDFVDDGENLWFCAASFNALFCMNKQGRNPVIMGRFPGEPAEKELLYSAVVKLGSMLYFAPHNANEIAIYDIGQNRFTKIPIPYKFDVKTAKFSTAFINHNDVFFVGCSCTAILKLNTISFDISIYDIKGFNPDISKETVFKFVTRGYQEGNRIILPTITDDRVYEFDMDSCTSQILFEGSRKSGYLGIAADGTNYWLISSDGKLLVKYIIEKKSIVCFKIPETYQEDNLFDYHIVLCIGTSVFIFPNQASYVLVFDTIAEGFSADDLLTRECSKGDNYGFYPNLSYMMAKYDGNTVYAHIGKNNKFITYKPSEMVLDSRRISLDEVNAKCANRLKHKSFEEKCEFTDEISECAFFETPLIQLPDFLDYINSAQDSYVSPKQVSLSKDIATNSNGTAGISIYNYMREQLGQ